MIPAWTPNSLCVYEVSPFRRAVKRSTAQTVPARGDQLGPSGLVSALGSIGSRSEPAVQSKTEHTQIYEYAELY